MEQVHTIEQNPNNDRTGVETRPRVFRKSKNIKNGLEKCNP